MTDIEATIVIMFCGSALAGIAMIALTIWLGRKK